MNIFLTDDDLKKTFHEDYDDGQIQQEYQKIKELIEYELLIKQ